MELFMMPGGLCLEAIAELASYLEDNPETSDAAGVTQMLTVGMMRNRGL